MIGPHTNRWESWLQKWFTALLVPAILVNAGGLFIGILEPDGALYATIAKTMARSGDFINLRVDGKDWLDKPHFPFWMAALSFRIFGVHAFAYKLPALLFWGAGAWYTYRLAFSLYGKPLAQLSVLIYVSAAHLVISNNDVRAEPYLTGLVIGSVYHFYRASRANPVPDGSRERSFLHLLAGSGLAACAIMTKGPFILITISAGFIMDWIMGKEWEQFRNIRWWIALLLIALFILPELYCLYVQFDLHPERTVFGRTHVSGVRFFFWDSQFGRFFNTGPIRGSGDPFFYFHTLLWAFLPWSLLLYAAIVQKCRGLCSVRATSQDAGIGYRHRTLPGDGICLGAALASFALFSLSRFQLPHYLNILFPFFSILTAGYLYGFRRRKTRRIIRIAQGTINLLLPAILLFLTWLFHFSGWPALLLVLLFLSLLPFQLFKGKRPAMPIARSFGVALLAYAFVNFCLYPAILKYQAGTQAGLFVDSYGRSFGPGLRRWGVRNEPTHPIDDSTVYMPDEAPVNYSFEFNCPLPVRRISMDSLPEWLRSGSRLIFSPSSYADMLKKRGYTVDILHQFPNFHVSQLTGEFLDYHSRNTVLEWYSMMWVSRSPGGPVFAGIP